MSNLANIAIGLIVVGLVSLAAHLALDAVIDHISGIAARLRPARTAG